MSTKNTRLDHLEKFITNGVIFTSPETVVISPDVEIGQGSVIGACVIIENKVKIGSNVKIDNGATIRNEVHIKDNVAIFSYACIHNQITIYQNAKIGQFTIIRDNVTIGAGTQIGPHCELTRSFIGCQAAFGHRNYVADASIADNVKFGVGASIANSNWEKTFKTTILANAKIGANAILIAPVTIGENAFVTAGAIITRDIPNNVMCISRAEPIFKLIKKK